MQQSVEHLLIVSFFIFFSVFFGGQQSYSVFFLVSFHLQLVKGCKLSHCISLLSR